MNQNPLLECDIKFYSEPFSGPVEVHKGTAFARTVKDNNSVIGIDIILDEKEDWDRDYSVKCQLTVINGQNVFVGVDKDVKVNCSFISEHIVMGIWIEGKEEIPFVLDLEQ